MTDRTVDSTVPAGFVQDVLDLARRRGIDPALLVRRAGLPPAVLDGARARASAAQVGAMIDLLWEETGDESIGIAPSPIPRGTIRLIGLSLVHARDLEDAFGRFRQYQRLVPGMPRLELTREGGSARVALHVGRLDHPEVAAWAFLLASVHRLTGWLVGRTIRLEAVELPFARPADVSALAEVFAAPLHFDCAVAALTTSDDVLSAPIVQDEASWLAFADRGPADLLRRREYGVDLADRVRVLVLRDLGGPWSTAEQVAAQLTMSPQTLRRRLAGEGTSLTEVREEVLRDEAIAGLVAGETVEALAARLGFSEPSAFRRAFRRWTGHPPGAYRSPAPAG